MANEKRSLLEEIKEAIKQTNESYIKYKDLVEKDPDVTEKEKKEFEKDGERNKKIQEIFEKFANQAKEEKEILKEIANEAYDLAKPIVLEGNTDNVYSAFANYVASKISLI